MALAQKMPLRERRNLDYMNQHILYDLYDKFEISLNLRQRCNSHELVKKAPSDDAKSAKESGADSAVEGL